jgi:hypothetical protein
MGVSVAEYLGVRIDAKIPIYPVNPAARPGIPCPFRNHHCDKLKRGLEPVCSVRDANQKLWVVCSHRLCATQPKVSALNDHQKSILRQVAKTIYSPTITDEEILVKREVSIPITADSDYSAEYVMWRRNPSTTHPFNTERAVVLEMQGGGETTNTGALTTHIKGWHTRVAAAGGPSLASNIDLARPTKASPLVTNAWRRQQEQFLVKGNVAMLTGGKMVFCVGPMIYDYLIQRLTTTTLVPLRNSNWTLALLAIAEDTTGTAPTSISAPNSIPLVIDAGRSLFTNYASFVQALTNQGAPCNSLFMGEYTDLTGNNFVV